MSLIKKLSHFVALSPQETLVLQDLQSGRRRVRRHRDIVSEGRKYDVIFVLVEGFAVRRRVLKNGGCQILNVALPGDLIGFPGCFFDSALYSVNALTDTVISPVPHATIAGLFRDSPQLAAKIFWSFACEAAIYTERLVDIGRRSALERVAHFLLELHARLEIIGRVEGGSFPMPFTQELIGDALGLSVPHVNRTLRQLRSDDLLVIEHQQAVIKDIEGLSALAGFHRAYLGKSSMPEALQSLERPKWPAEPPPPVEPAVPANGGDKSTEATPLVEAEERPLGRAAPLSGVAG